MPVSLRLAFPRSSGTRHWHWSFRVGTMVAELSSLTAFIAMGITYAARDCVSSAVPTLPVADSVAASAKPTCSNMGWDVISIPILSFALLWNTAEFATARVNGRGIHPGAHIAIDLCIFAGLACATVMTLLIFDNTAAHIAAIPFEMLACLIHLILFIFACIEVHRRRNADREKLLALTQQILDTHESKFRQQQYQLQLPPQPPFASLFAPPAEDIEMSSLPPLPPGLAYVAPLPANAHPVLKQDGVMYYAVPMDNIGQAPPSPFQSVKG